MKSFNVLYAGQLRFVECAQYHLSKIKNANSIDAVFFNDLSNTQFKYSVNNLTFNEALEYFTKTINPNSCTVVDHLKYSRHYPKYRQLLLMIEHIEETDVVFLMTPELVFNRWSFLNFKFISQFVPQDTPKVFAWSTEKNSIHNHFLYLNRKAIQQLKQKWGESSFPFFLHTEECWYHIIKECGIDIVHTRTPSMAKCLKFKPNMDFTKIRDFKYIEKQRKIWDKQTIK
jgi:hypothetical protein